MFNICRIPDRIRKRIFDLKRIKTQQKKIICFKRNKNKIRMSKKLKEKRGHGTLHVKKIISFVKNL